ncbi:MAG: hypothetical protein ACREF8_06880 [Chthoniobacterales bacterium]
MARAPKPEYERPRTGEKRAVRQPFAIDKLPSAWRDQIIAWRAKWLTWEQIEEATKNLDWKKLEESDPELALSHFADKRIPKSTLHKWYDVQVAQKAEEIEAERQASLAIAEKFSQGGYEKLDESVKNALADVVFRHAKDSADSESFRKALADLAWILARNRQLDIQKERAELAGRKVGLEEKKFEELRSKADKATNEAAAKIGKGRTLTIDDINRIRERALGLPPVAG